VLLTAGQPVKACPVATGPQAVVVRDVADVEDGDAEDVEVELDTELTDCGCATDVLALLTATEPPTPPPTNAAVTTIPKARDNQNVVVLRPHSLRTLGLESSGIGGYWCPYVSLRIKPGCWKINPGCSLGW
jgi:hypothetical protein